MTATTNVNVKAPHSRPSSAARQQPPGASPSIESPPAPRAEQPSPAVAPKPNAKRPPAGAPTPAQAKHGEPSGVDLTKTPPPPPPACQPADADSLSGVASSADTKPLPVAAASPPSDSASKRAYDIVVEGVPEKLWSDEDQESLKSFLEEWASDNQDADGDSVTEITRVAGNNARCKLHTSARSE